MKGKSMNFFNHFLMPVLLGVLAAGVVWISLSGRDFPLLSNPRTALIVLVVIGMAMCGGGGLNMVALSGRWTSPFAILGYLLGAAILVVFVSALAGWKLPLVASVPQAVAVIGVLILAKFVIGKLGYLFHWL